MYGILDQLIKDQTVGTFEVSCGTPITLALSSSSCQIIGRNDDEAEMIFIGDDFKILQGSE